MPSQMSSSLQKAGISFLILEKQTSATKNIPKMCVFVLWPFDFCFGACSVCFVEREKIGFQIYHSSSINLHNSTFRASELSICLNFWLRAQFWPFVANYLTSPIESNICCYKVWTVNRCHLQSHLWFWVNWFSQGEGVLQQYMAAPKTSNNRDSWNNRTPKNIW
jgi:hypothetical protein